MSNEAVEPDEAEFSEFYEGYRDGYVGGFADGIEIGRDQGYQDCLYRIKRMAENIFDPEIERAIKILEGED